MIMNRRLGGTWHTSCPRSPNLLPIGHLSNKSSLYSPTSMSHMSQDLVYNHMRSHYQRIASAKACVDTSAPRSMKLLIKERDRRRRESFQKTTQSRQNSMLDHGNINCTKKLSMDGVMRSGRTSTTNEHSSGHSSCINTRKHDATKRSIGTNIKPHKNDGDLSSVLLFDSRGGNVDVDLYHGSINNLRNDDKITNDHSLLTKGPALQYNGDLEQVNNLVSTHFDQLYTSTPRFATETEEHGLTASHPTRLAMSNVSFSYKASPSPKKQNKKSSAEVIWTEEQKYLQFISEVTNDILMRGIFSNRVLSRVFESHIERRKDDLDEEQMRELINQLKEDLGIKDY